MLGIGHRGKISGGIPDRAIFSISTTGRHHFHGAQHQKPTTSPRKTPPATNPRNPTRNAPRGGFLTLSSPQNTKRTFLLRARPWRSPDHPPSPRLVRRTWAHLGAPPGAPGRTSAHLQAHLLPWPRNHVSRGRQKIVKKIKNRQNDQRTHEWSGNCANGGFPPETWTHKPIWVFPAGIGPKLPRGRERQRVGQRVGQRVWQRVGQRVRQRVASGAAGGKMSLAIFAKLVLVSKLQQKMSSACAGSKTSSLPPACLQPAPS